MTIKNILNTSVLTFGLLGQSIAAPVESIKRDIHQASYIQFDAHKGQETNLGDFLKQGAKLVRKTEPQTKLWFALQGNAETFGIFDVFPDNKGREIHFSGKVASALHDKAADLIKGGWEEGILNNVQNSEILSNNHYHFEKILKATKASYIVLKVQPGKGKDLEILLHNAANIITQSEPETSLWLALKIDSSTYAIFDTFTNEAARTTHFKGIVAETLKENAQNLIVGGWDKGVLNNVHHFNIVASS